MNNENASAASELHDQPHQQHERSEASQADGQDDEQLGALGVADEGVHGAIVGAAPATNPGIGDVPDPRFAGGWVNPPGADLTVATTSSEGCQCAACLQPWFGEPCLTNDDDEPMEHCDCTAFCAMGPTCPGGWHLPGAGCHRAAPHPCGCPAGTTAEEHDENHSPDTPGGY